MSIPQLSKLNREDIQKKVIEKLTDKLSRQIEAKIENGVNPFEAYDQILHEFLLDEEIILKFEYEAEKAGFSKDLDLIPKEVELIEEEINQQLFQKFLKEV